MTRIGICIDKFSGVRRLARTGRADRLVNYNPYSSHSYLAVDRVRVDGRPIGLGAIKWNDALLLVSSEERLDGRSQQTRSRCPLSDF